MRFLSTHGMRMEGHEFKYYRSPQGDEFISRRVVGRFDGDVDWFQERLSAPDQVKVDGNGTLRFHIRHADDFEVLKAALQDAYDRAAS